MWRFAVSLVGVLALAGCTPDHAVGKPSPAAASPARPAQAVAAALAFAAHSDTDVAVVDGYATVPLPVQGGEQQIDRAEGHPRPCAQSPAQPFICVPGPQEVLVSVHWDGHAWQAVATGAG